MTKKKRQRKEARKGNKVASKVSQSRPIAGVHYPDFDNQEYYYVVGSGHPDEMESMSFHYIEQSNGTKVVCLFSSEETAEACISGPLQHPEAYMDVLESQRQPEVFEAFQNEQFFVMPVDVDSLAMVLDMVETRSITLDPGTGKETQVVSVGG